MLPEYLITNSSAPEFLEGLFSSDSFSRIGILVDENTFRDCYPRIQKVLPDHIIFQIKSGELNKNLDTCQSIWDQLTEEGFDRHSLFINLGGGVIGDMGGFCASTFKRGMRFINFPTTLLAQVDASIGGKLGIDYGDYKNHIGLFADPYYVVVDEHFLSTLPDREVLSGFAEVLKHSLIADQDHWQTLKSGLPENHNWQQIIQHSLRIKSGIVMEDPYEKGLRKVLNFGHTLGHAVESHFLASPDPLLHGEAIAIGMVMETHLSGSLCGLSKGEQEEIVNTLINLYGHHKIGNDQYENIFTRTLQDKKNRDGRVQAVLLKSIGNPVDEKLEREEILKAIEFYDNLR